MKTVRFEYDGYLIEEAVFREMLRRATAGDAADYGAYRRRLDEIYENPGCGDRESVGEALRHEHVLYFRRLGFWHAIGGVLEAYPLLNEKIDLLSVQAAQRRNAEGAELFVREGDTNSEEVVRTLVLCIYPESFLDLPQLRAFLRRELYPISDMLDPAFGYVPDRETAAPTSAQENLIRDRYAVLWDIYTERRILGRAHDAGTAEQDIPERLRTLAGKAYAGLPRYALEERLQRAWTGDNITHDELLALASESVQTGDSDLPQPSAPCPSCGFPTHEWVRTRSGYCCLQCSEMLDTPACSRELQCARRDIRDGSRAM